MATNDTSKNTNRGNIIILVVVLLAAVAITITCGIGSSVNGKWFKNANVLTWFNSWGKAGNTDTGEDPGPQIMAISDEGEELFNGGTYAMPKAMTIVAAAASETDSVPGGEFTLTPTLDNEYISGVFDFDYYFAEYSSWAAGKNVSDYISVTPVGTSSAKVKLIDAFSAPIEIKVTLSGTSTSATCRVDYLKRVTSGMVSMASTDMDTRASMVFPTLSYGAGTVTGNFDYESVTLDLTPEFISTFKSYLKFDIAVKSCKLTEDNSELSNKSSGLPDMLTVEKLTYSMFIEGFDDYDAKHKDAIYYAWYVANKEVAQNVSIDYSFKYGYKNLEFHITNPQATQPQGRITGAKYGATINPDIDLNGDVVF